MGFVVIWDDNDFVKLVIRKKAHYSREVTDCVKRDSIIEVQQHPKALITLKSGFACGITFTNPSFL